MAKKTTAEKDKSEETKDADEEKITLGDPNAGPTCVYKSGESKILTGLDVEAAYQDGWCDVPTDHPNSRE